MSTISIEREYFQHDLNFNLNISFIDSSYFDPPEHTVIARVKSDGNVQAARLSAWRSILPQSRLP